MRIANLASLEFDKHVKLPFQSKTGETTVLIPSDQVKNRQPLMFILSDDVTALLIKHRELIKPVLEKEVTPYLFPNGRGTQKRSDTLSKQIKKLIWDKLGIKFNPHLIRHLSVKLFLDAYPGNYEGARRLLGHANEETTYNAYGGLETKSASRLHNDIIRGLRRYVPVAKRSTPKKGS